MIKEDFFISHGLRINYASGGAGSPMLFLHNGSGFWQSWQHQLNYFSKRYTVYAIDWPGCGGSDYPEGGLNMKLLEQSLNDFISQKKLNDIILVGNCIGASAAINYAVNSPDNINKLVLLNMCPGDLLFPATIPKNLVKRVSNSEFWLKKGEWLLDLVYNKWVIKSMFPKRLFGKNMDRNDEFYHFYRSKQFSKKQIQARLDLFFNAHTYNLEPIIADVKIPKHILIWGAENRVLPLERFGLSHKERLQPQEFYAIEGAGHLCMYERPEHINKLIQEYIDQ